MRRTTLVMAALLTLAGCAKGLEGQLEELRSGDPARVQRAAAVLASDPSADATRGIVDAADREAKPATRAAAVKLLPSRHLSGAISILLQRARDPEPEVRLATVQAMVELGNPQALAWLESDGATDPDPGVKSAAADAAARLHASAADWYLAIAGDDAAPVPARIEAVNVLGPLKDPRAVPLLVGMFPKLEQPEARQSILWALGDIATPDALTFVRGQLRSDGYLNRSAAIYVAGAQKDVAAVPDLILLMQKDGSVANRIGATRALGMIGGPDAVSALKTLLADTKADPQQLLECREALKTASATVANSKS